MIQRTQQENPQPSSQAIIELITTIIAYKFTQLTRREVEEMLGITFEETQFYRDIKQEGLEEGEERGEQRGREKGQRNLILRQLNRRVGELSSEVR